MFSHKSDDDILNEYGPVVDSLRRQKAQQLLRAGLYTPDTNVLTIKLNVHMIATMLEQADIAPTDENMAAAVGKLAEDDGYWMSGYAAKAYSDVLKDDPYEVKVLGVDTGRSEEPPAR